MILQSGTDRIPASAGVGLRSQHYTEFAGNSGLAKWLEVHPENYFGNGGAPLYYLEEIRKAHPLSLHGVGLSLGSSDSLNLPHLNQLKVLIERFEPALVSEHLSWGSFNGSYMNDLLPLPYTEEALAHFCDRVAQTQEYLGRQILIENPSSYLSYTHSTIPEHEFFVAVSDRTGCGLLLDINNVFVSAENHGLDARQWLDAVPLERVGEIHLAGHARNTIDDSDLLIDDHGSPVCDEVWELFRRVVSKRNDIPVLIEWDSAVPELAVLLGEAAKADTVLENSRARAA